MSKKKKHDPRILLAHAQPFLKSLAIRLQSTHPEDVLRVTMLLSRIEKCLNEVQCWRARALRWKPRYSKDGYNVLTLCLNCAHPRYCEALGTTAECACSLGWTESVSIPFWAGDARVSLTAGQCSTLVKREREDHAFLAALAAHKASTSTTEGA